MHLLIVGTQARFHISNTESAALVRRDGCSFLVKFPLPIVFFLCKFKKRNRFFFGWYRVLSVNILGSPHKFGFSRATSITSFSRATSITSFAIASLRNIF